MSIGSAGRSSWFRLIRGAGVAIAATMMATATAGCALNALGHEEIVTESRQVTGVAQLADDNIADKKPTFAAGRTITETFNPGGFDSCAMTLNKSATVTKLDVVPFEAADAALEGRLFRGRREALAALAAIPGEDVIPSMELVNGYLKPFNDGLYATVELEEEPAKKALLETLLARLGQLLSTPGTSAAARPALEDASVLVGAALSLGGQAPAIDATLQSRVQARVDTFEAEVSRARPIGFYTWAPALKNIFTRDRFLQNADGAESFGAFAALAWVLGQDAALLGSYQHVTALYAGLTNPYVSYSLDALVPFVSSLGALADPVAIETAFQSSHPLLDPCAGILAAFQPASRSKEVSYFDSLFCDTGVPAGTSTLDVLVEGIQSGAVDLAPGQDAGWYDYQLAALETLLVPARGPEDQHLLLTAGYKKKLIETFKSILIQNRETHVKQLSGSKAVSAEKRPVDLYPLLPAEPFPTFYLRTARAYRFLDTFLKAVLGDPFLSRATRLTETGVPGALPLGVELRQRISLLYGLFFISADALGLSRDGNIGNIALMADELTEIDAASAIASARTWLGGWTTDPDVARDPRVIVPVLREDAFVRYWAVVGVEVVKTRAEFVPGHEPMVTPTDCWTGKFAPHTYALLTEASVEVRLPVDRPPPTRDELRAICDAHATKDAIAAALGSQ